MLDGVHVILAQQGDILDDALVVETYTENLVLNIAGVKSESIGDFATVVPMLVIE